MAGPRPPPGPAPAAASERRKPESAAMPRSPRVDSFSEPEAAPGPPAPRRRLRRKNRRQLNPLLLARAAAGGFMLLELLHAAFASPRLAVQTVRVQGVHGLPPAR